MSKPVAKLHSDVLGTVKLSCVLAGNHYEYEAQINLQDKTLDVLMYSDEKSGEIADTILHATNIIENFDSHLKKTRIYVNEQIIALSGDASQTTQAEDKGQQITNLFPNSICVHSDGKSSFAFDSQPAFQEHALVVYLDSSGTIIDHDTPG